MIYIFNVIGKPCFPAKSIPAVHLRQSGQSRTYIMASSLFLCIIGQITHKQRSWPDQAHISFKDIEQLRQLIQARGS